MSTVPQGVEFARNFLATSPFGTHVGLEAGELSRDRAELVLPFAEHVITIADVVHGGAIATLVDTAATAAVWCTDELPENLRGTTVSLSLAFSAAARAQDVTARAAVFRRGRSLSFCDVEATDAAGNHVARGLVTYKLG
jgi:uncharacterized protein (TIGR00369 family)